MLSHNRRENHQSCHVQKAEKDCFEFQRLFCVFCLAVAILAANFLVQPAMAEAADLLIVQPLAVDQFPLMTVQLRPWFFPDRVSSELRVDQLEVLENGQPVTLLTLDQHQHGIHLTLAINGGRDLDLRDASGLSPFNKLANDLQNWVETRSFHDEDIWSLVTNERFEVRNTSQAESWIMALNTYKPDFRAMTPELAALELAIVNARDRVMPFGMDKVILYITVPPTGEQVEPIRALTEEARAAGIYISVWMVGDPYFLTTRSGEALNDIAGATGGELFHYTGFETLPDPEAYLMALGTSYTLVYTSGIRMAGTYSLQIQAETPAGMFSGESPHFIIDVQPPKPILLAPPTRITRAPAPGVPDPAADLIPDRYDVNIMVTFPDGYPREIVASRLFVNGDLSVEQSEEPFDVLTWDLSSLSKSGEYVIEVEIEDNLGLSSRTIPTPVQIEVTLPEPEAALDAQQIGMQIAGVVLVLALIIVFLWGVKVLWVRFEGSRLITKFFHGRNEETPALIEPLEMFGDNHAWLIPLEEFAQVGGGYPIQFSRSQLTLGNDPEKADIVLDVPDISGMHARLCLRKGTFWLNDLGSKNGTWVNYERIGMEPVKIQAGDLLHFGYSGFRFTIIEPGDPSVVAIEKYEPLL